MHATTRRRFAALIAGAAATALGVPAVAQVVIHERVMPAPLVEVIPVAPGPNYHWVPGHWVWYGRRWVWVRGHYVLGVVPPMPAAIVETPPPPPGPAWFWVRGHYFWRSRWVWRPGRWVR